MTSAADIRTRFRERGFVVDDAFATALEIMLALQKPLLIEGPAGVGKTESAKVLAEALQARLIRLECYEGLDAMSALYEWNYPRQMLHARLSESSGATIEQREAEIFYSEAYLLKRPLLEALTGEQVEAGEGLQFSKEDALLQADRVKKEIEQAEANGQAARARVLEAKANLENAQKEYDRATELFRRQFVAETLKDAAETAWQVAQSKYQVALESERGARAQLELAKANERSIVLKQQSVRIAEQVQQRAKLGLGLAREEKRQIQIQEKNIELLKAKVQEAEATFRLAEIRLQETSVASPVTGVVSKRFADQGQLVQQGQPVFTDGPSHRSGFYISPPAIRIGPPVYYRPDYPSYRVYPPADYYEYGYRVWVPGYWEERWTPYGWEKVWIPGYWRYEY